MTRPAEWGRLARRHWSILALVLVVPVLIGIQTPWLAPFLVGVYALVGLLTFGVWRRWGYRAGRRLVWSRPKEGVVLARLQSRPSARELPSWRILLMFLAPAAFGFFLANGLARVVSSRLGVTLTFDDLGIFVVAAMASICFLSVFVVPVGWIVRASGIRKVHARNGRNDPLRPVFLVDHLTAATGVTALVVLATSVRPDETVAPMLDMLLNTLTVAALALPGTLLATLLYVWFALDRHVVDLERDLGARPVGTFFDVRTQQTDATSLPTDRASAPAVAPERPPNDDADDAPAGPGASG